MFVPLGKITSFLKLDIIFLSCTVLFFWISLYLDCMIPRFFIILNEALIFSENLSLLARLDQVDRDTSKTGGGTQAVIIGLHYSLGRGMIVAPTLRMTTPESGDSDNSIVVNFEFKF